MNPEELKKLMQSKDLSYDEEIAKSQFERGQDRFVLVCEKKTNEKFIFKGLINKNELAKEKFYNEINLLNEYLRKTSPFKIDKIINQGEKPTKWLLVKFFEGEVAGNIFEFKDEILTKDFNVFLISSIEWLQQNPVSSEIKSNHKFIYWLDKVENKITNSNIGLNIEKFKKAKDSLLEYASFSENLFISHNNLSPLNIIIQTNKHLIVDWELSGYNIAPFDYAYVYHRLWRHPKFQEKFLKNIEKKDAQFMKMFKYILTILIQLDLITFEKTFEGFKFKHGQKFSSKYILELQKLYKKKLRQLEADL